MEHTISELHQLQALPLSDKVEMTRERIKAWVDHWGLENCAISFSGGKDSTVLLDMARMDYPDMETVHVSTGLEYPEIEDFVNSYSNVTILEPKMNFVEVIRKYGYPMISKEVAETVQGARKYLTSITGNGTLDRPDTVCLSVRQALRTREISEDQSTSSNTTSYADAASMRNPTPGGYDRKYRKVRGIGEFDAVAIRQKERSSVSDGEAAGLVDEGQSDKGEYP